MTRLIPIAVALYLCLQAADALRLGYANWLAPRDAAAATRLAPQNVAYRLAAALAEEDPQPGIKAAARLSPRDASLRIRLGLAAEQAGDPRAAERSFLEAARLSRKYEPRWTLAGFYFRQNRTDDFWRWAREAVKMSYRDPQPLFDLAWEAGKDGAVIRNKLEVEARPEMWRAWVRHAAATGRLDEVEAVLDRVTPEPAVIEALLAGKRIKALARLGGHHALDWRAIPQDGIVFHPQPDGRGFSLTFDGRQPEQCDVAARISLERRDWPISGTVRGLSWHSEPFGREGQWVTLRYRRPAGETRAVGTAQVAE